MIKRAPLLLQFDWIKRSNLHKGPRLIDRCCGPPAKQQRSPKRLIKLPTPIRKNPVHHKLPWRNIWIAIIRLPGIQRNVTIVRHRQFYYTALDGAQARTKVPAGVQPILRTKQFLPLPVN